MKKHSILFVFFVFFVFCCKGENSKNLNLQEKDGSLVGQKNSGSLAVFIQDKENFYEKHYTLNFPSNKKKQLKFNLIKKETLENPRLKSLENKNMSLTSITSEGEIFDHFSYKSEGNRCFLSFLDDYSNWIYLSKRRTHDS